MNTENLAPVLSPYFTLYPQSNAPFMHQQLAKWSKTRPLSGLKVLHHVPVVPNTLLKIACLIAAGAQVTVTHPKSFCNANPDAINSLIAEGIEFVGDIKSLSNVDYDLYFDCGAELFQCLGKPKIGAIELTASGDAYYRKASHLDFPVISVDRTLTKQLETVFGCAESSAAAFEKLTGTNPCDKSWLIFGFGKIGRGLAYFCVHHQTKVVVAEICEQARLNAQALGIKTIDARDIPAIKTAVSNADFIVTATGHKEIMNAYDKQWFQGKILANLGIYDEFGSGFSKDQVLNNKQALNFVLHDPTPMKYIDPEFYIHNEAALLILKENLAHGVHDIPREMDSAVINQWCTLHSVSLDEINTWFVV